MADYIEVKDDAGVVVYRFFIFSLEFNISPIESFH